jgi:hypothetical protein
MKKWQTIVGQKWLQYYDFWCEFVISSDGVKQYFLHKMFL